MLTTAPPLRTAILAAARRLCFDRGVAALSARKIAAAVGCSPTAIYLHFDGIDHVLHHLRMEGHALLVEYLAAADPDQDGAARIVAMQRHYHRFGCDHPRHFELMFLARLDPVALGALAAREGSSLDVVRDAAARGIARREITGARDPVVVANVAWMSVHGVTSMVVAGHAAVTAPGLEAALLDGVTGATLAWLRGGGR